MEWVSAIRRGIPSSAVDALTAFLLVSQTEFSDALDIPVRTLVRRKGEGLLNSEESAKLVRVARVIQRAEEVFDNPVSARDWLKSANTSLGGETPMSLLDTEIGAEAVIDTLGRIEHGVFA
jgi:putative toxin-antitoxin system antitoxin component (TIGR02293 family)